MDLQVVFQDPYSSLNPSRTIRQTLGEVLLVNAKRPRAEVRDRVESMLDRVGLPSSAADRYPAQFSGGQRQRIAIARALMTEPQLIICDEPVTALDLSVQAQVLNLLRELQQELQLSYLFIAHDLDVVRHLSDRIVVLYRGRVMEEGPAKRVYEQPAHPYTQALLDAAPVPDPERQRQRRLHPRPQPQEPRLETSERSCPFARRCPYATDRCHTEEPALEPTDYGTRVACHYWRELRNAPTETTAARRLLPS